MKSELGYWSSGAGPPGGGTPHPMSRLGKEVAAMKRKCCNCKNSRCLKLYCECFAAGVYCDGCNCQNCLNNEANEMMRKEAIEATLERNPTAFRPKIAAAPRSGQMETKHNKGCHCKKSSCLKKYCECFQAGIYCSENCKCVDCKNVDPDGPGRGGPQSSQGGYPANPQYYSQSPARSSSSMRQTGCFFEPPSGSSRYDAYNQASPRYDVGAPSPGGRYDSQPLALTGPGQSIHAFSEPGVVNVVKRTRFDATTVPPRGQYDQSMGRQSSFDGRTGRSSDDVIRFGPPGHPMPVGSRLPTFGPTTTPFSHPAHSPAQPAPDLHGLRNAIADIINEEMAVDVCSALLNVAGQEEERHHANRGPRAAWTGHSQGTPGTTSTGNPKAAPAPSQPSASAVKLEPRSEDLDFPMPEPDWTLRVVQNFASAHVDAPSPDGPLSDALACNEPSTPPWGTSDAPQAGPPGSSDHMSSSNLAAQSSFSPRQGQHVRQPGSQNRTFSPTAFFATPLRGKVSRRQAQPQAPQEQVPQRPVSPITAQLLCEEEPHAHHSGDDAGPSFSDSMLSQRQEMQEHAVLEQFTVCLTKVFDSARRKALAGQPFPLPSAGQHHPGIDSMLRPSPPVRPQNANPYSYAPVAASFGNSSPSPPQTDTFRRNCGR